MKFKIGDRVTVIHSSSIIDIKNEPGTIKYIETTSDPFVNRFGIEFDRQFHPKLHNCDGKTKHKHGWLVLESKLTLLPEFKPGDKVTVKTKASRTPKEWHGQIGIVREETLRMPDYKPIRFDKPIKSLCDWNVFTEDLELISESEPLEKQTDTELPPGYIRTLDGFITNPNNWKPGKRLI